MQKAGEQVFWIRKHPESADRGQSWPYSGYRVFQYHHLPARSLLPGFPTTAAIPLHLNTFVVLKKLETIRIQVTRLPKNFNRLFLCPNFLILKLNRAEILQILTYNSQKSCWQTH